MTPPRFAPGTRSNRDALAGGLAFLDGSASPEWGVDDLCRWFTDHLVTPGYMMTPLVVTETAAGTLPLYGQTPASPQGLRRILDAARSRVLTTLRGLVASTVDDRFLAEGIFAGRLWRQRVGGASRWVPRPESTTPLSGIVLSLFAVDVLSHRELYAQLLSVCDMCDRVTFHEGSHYICAEHLPHRSGTIRKVTAEQEREDPREATGRHGR
jgi:hypothetical protein